jgi:putative aldouronate transport system substrate-binding protein
MGTNINEFLKMETAGMTYEQIMKSADGNIYYMPGLAFSTVNRAYSKMWINKEWLDTLGLETPKTTQQFKEVLQAFATGDPNQNGVADEIPLVGTVQNPTYSIYDYLIGSFIANNVRFHRLLVNDGAVSYAANTDEWREAMKYINDLTTNGLLSPLTFTQDLASLKQMVNDNNNIVGGYTSLGVQGVAVANNPEIISRYVGLAPLEGPKGVRHGVLSIPTPSANGVITSECMYPEAVFRLFDFMLSEEASTLSRFGIEGEHWVVPEEGALTNYGMPATINIVDNIWNIPQNTMWQNQCPYINRQGDGQQRSENPNDPVRKNCEAAVQYLECEPQNIIPTLTYSLDEIDEVNDIVTNINDYVDTMVAKFAVGELNPYDDDDWNRYLREFEVLELDRLLEISQTAYDRMSQ